MAGSDFRTIPTSEFASFALETLLIGIFVVTYGIALCVLLIRDRARWNTASFITSTTMLILALAHWVLDIHICYTGFVVYGGTNKGAKFLANARSPVYIAKSVLYVTQTLLGDAFMAYRIFILWNSSWAVTIGPILLICAAAVTGYTSCCMLSQDIDGKDLVSMKTPYSGWFLAFLSIATFYTVFTTALVAIRIYRWKRRAQRHNPYVPIPRRRVLETFIQSAAIYPVVLVSLFVTYVLGVNPEMFGVDLLPALIGIASTLITIRLGLDDVAGGKRRTQQNVNFFVRRANGSPQMLEGQHTPRRPPPTKAPIIEPQEDMQESLVAIGLGDPWRSSTATGFGQDLLLALQRVLDLDSTLSYETHSRAHPAVLLAV